MLISIRDQRKKPCKVQFELFFAEKNTALLSFNNEHNTIMNYKPV